MVMSNHIHLALRAGEEPLARWIGPLNTWLAQRLNTLQVRHGPVVQERPTTIYMPTSRAERLIPYLHNNPVRAGCIAERENPSWTSHAFYADAVERPSSLAVEQGLSLCGFGCDESGRYDFIQLVEERISEDRDSSLSGDDVKLRRSAARLSTGAPVELESPLAFSNELRYGLVGENLPLRPLGMSASPEAVIAIVGTVMGVAPSDMTSRSRVHKVVAARRVSVHLWRQLSRPMVEISTALGISRSAASRHLYRGREEDLERARLDAASIAKTLHAARRKRDAADASSTKRALLGSFHR